jgi:hypothetical protein
MFSNLPAQHLELSQGVATPEDTDVEDNLRGSRKRLLDALASLAVSLTCRMTRHG